MDPNRREGFIKRNWGLIYSLISLFFDIILLNAALIVSILLRFGHLRDFRYYTKAQIFMNLVFVLLSLGLGVYRSRYNMSRDELRSYYKRLVIFIAVVTRDIDMVPGNLFAPAGVLMSLKRSRCKKRI